MHRPMKLYPLSRIFSNNPLVSICWESSSSSIRVLAPSSTRNRLQAI
uniref:Uncharacterized protein n=1 Tax=Arundo donax TaxID=35708 RepID=A0A0A8YKE7_ARUDO